VTATLLGGIGLLARQDPTLGELHDAAVVVDGDATAWVGAGSSAPAAGRRVSLDGRAMIPGSVDSHAHLPRARRTPSCEAGQLGAPWSAAAGSRHWTPLNLHR
jgi:imidazolonepropionase